MERFAIDESRLHEDVSLQDDLELDSVDAMDLFMALSDTFKIQITEKQMIEVKTLGDLVSLVEKRKGII